MKLREAAETRALPRRPALHYRRDEWSLKNWKGLAVRANSPRVNLAIARIYLRARTMCSANTLIAFIRIRANETGRDTRESGRFYPSRLDIRAVTRARGHDPYRVAG